MGPPGDEDELERRVSLTDTEGDLSRLDQPSTEALVDTISAKFRQFKRIYVRHSLGIHTFSHFHKWVAFTL